MLGERKRSCVHLTERNDVAVHGRGNSQKKGRKALTRGAYVTSKLCVGRLLKLKTMADPRARKCISKLQSLLHMQVFAQPFQSAVFQLSWILPHHPLRPPAFAELMVPQNAVGTAWWLQNSGILLLGWNRIWAWSPVDLQPFPAVLLQWSSGGVRSLMEGTHRAAHAPELPCLLPASSLRMGKGHHRMMTESYPPLARSFLKIPPRWFYFFPTAAWTKTGEAALEESSPCALGMVL